MLDRMGFIRVYHHDTGTKRTYPISPKIYNNKEKMAQLGYYDIPEPEAPVIEEEEEEIEVGIKDEPIEQPKADAPKPKKRGRPRLEEYGK